MSYTMFVPTRILFGIGRLSELHQQPMPGKKALLVISDGRSVKASGALERTEAELEKAGIEWKIFDRVNANPTKSVVMAGAKAARDNSCDFVVALGGGSVMDASKTIALMATNDGDLWEYVKGRPVPNNALPIVAITTTAGTGSESDATSVVTNEDTKEKIGYRHPSMFPTFSIVDPELMKTVPPIFTAYQGFDALFHATESYISVKANLMSDLYAEGAIKNVGKYLARAVADGSDMEAREGMAFANTLSGAVMTIAGCTSEHSLEHALSAYHPALPHGAGLIMIARAYYAHFARAGVCDERFIAMAKMLGKEDAREAMDFVTALDELMKKCGVADLKMSDYGLSENEFATITANAKTAMVHLFSSDRVYLEDDDCMNILKESYL